MPYDSTQTTSYMICPFKYYLQFIAGIKKAEVDDTTVRFTFGQYVHKYLENLYNGIEANVWDEYEDFFDEYVLTKENGIRLCGMYRNRYEEENKSFTILDVEKVIEFPIGRHTFVVKLDTVVGKQGCTYSLEHKTSQKSPQYAFKTFEMAAQITAQTYAVRRVHGACSGVIIDLIVPKFVTKPILLDVNHPDVSLYTIVEKKYCKYYKSEMAYCSGFTALFERNIFNRFSEQLDGWLINQERIIEQIERDKDANYFVKHDTGYMCGMCEYRELCMMSHGMELDAGILDMMYIKVENPLAYIIE